MVQQMMNLSKKKILIVLFLLTLFFSICLNIKLFKDITNGSNHVRCIECYKKTNQLVRDGQCLTPPQDTYPIGDTIDELLPQIQYAFPWMCENCAYDIAQEYLETSK